ncbi:hypothetical protein E3N88_11449 [Mikania micrantha]|uniref:Glutaredoxin domain-containing protein n=1 Tax=Mikania micrantha TaxID=192012 RepID=A0A5N6PEH3_9ASTR|nr:hypothetical protein E3N88_11449 [Mikania micrantha]
MHGIILSVESPSDYVEDVFQVGNILSERNKAKSAQPPRIDLVAIRVVKKGRICNKAPSNQNSQDEFENRKVKCNQILLKSIKALFYELGASPEIHEVDHDADMERALKRLGCNPAIPAVFIGGKYVGSARDVISLHVDGSLKQKLIEASSKMGGPIGLCNQPKSALVQNEVMGSSHEKQPFAQKCRVRLHISDRETSSPLHKAGAKSSTSLFQELGVKPLVHELDHDPDGWEIEKALVNQGCNPPPIPVVFIGGNLVGSINEVMSLHLRGALIPLLGPYQTLA